LGVGGERLHYWVFGGPWRYDSPGRGEPTGTDKEWLEEVLGVNGAVVVGRGTYEAAGHWGDKNPWGIPAFVVTHRPEEQPPGDEFTLIIAPLVLGAGKALFDGFSRSIELEHLRVRQSPFATFLDYRVKK